MPYREEVYTLGTYNGWANRDTWLVVVWADNELKNYEYLKANYAKLMKMPKAQLFATLRARLHFGDKINWNNVNATEIKRYLEEFKEA